MDADKLSKKLAESVIAFFAGYYSSKNSTEIRIPNSRVVENIIRADIKMDRPKYEARGQLVYALPNGSGVAKYVYTANTPAEAKEISDAFNTYA